MYMCICSVRQHIIKLKTTYTLTRIQYIYIHKHRRKKYYIKNKCFEFTKEIVIFIQADGRMFIEAFVMSVRVMDKTIINWPQAMALIISFGPYLYNYMYIYLRL